MEITVLEQTPDYCHLSLRGRMDLDGIHRNELKFLSNTASLRRNSIVDMSKVDFIVSFGIRMLLSTAKTLKRSDAQLILINPTPEVTKVLEIAGLLRAFPIVPDKSSAMKLILKANNINE